MKPEGIYRKDFSFRNMLMHRYESIDEGGWEGLVFGIFNKYLGNFDLFFRLVTDWSGGQP
jgi:uncharacterized protein YutE (UPF0331/DUF86 family)